MPKRTPRRRRHGSPERNRRGGGLRGESFGGDVQTPAKEGNVAELRRLRVGEAGGVPVDATDSMARTALH